ncbi:DUF1501 domain-containing protein [Chenggangzhangella methanolivorans]|uniref:DUF1501 domain-containing protein n=1 Tax=Chenggangzhangella methanolivorans TaxID=1437009 RepID=A0A9E6R6A7_9HYPH|nr:DUF1501 domain-containing protein [Chenggangzhangella methanolivorans]QZN98678.1 DUF1501 domain-containing protein [Chenggangzhangella methanolivorans]
MTDPVSQRLAAAAAEGCAESRLLLSRRAVFGITAGLFSAAYLPQTASAASDDPRLLIVVLRGGMDGINVVVPHGDAAYAGMRGRIAIPRDATLSLNTSYFGLNSALPSFGQMYLSGQAAAVHAVCTPLQNRSHFDCQDNLESGLPGLSSNPTGWLNRLLSSMPSGSPIDAYGAIQVGEAPLLLRGPAPVLGWSPTWFSHPPAPTSDAVVTLLRKRDTELYDALRAGMKADALAEKTSSDEDQNVSQFRRAFRGAGRLLASSNGPRIAVLSVGNFDTHANQGATDGFLWGSLNELDVGLKEFADYAAPVWSKTVVVMATEFGRTVRVNSGNGTDHGVGTVALLAGGAVQGGKVYGDWPGLAASQLVDDSDLKATTDLRAVFKGVLADHVGVPRNVLDTTVFPDSADVAPMQGLIRGSAPSSAKVAGVRGPSKAALRPTTGIAKYRAAYGV